jgi:photosystem II stability/assembly factor-like uncharacterized protein
MSMNKIIPVFSSLAVVAGVFYLGTSERLSSSEGLDLLLSKSNTTEELKSEEQGIRGALESIYSWRLNEKTQTVEPEWVEQAIAQADAMKTISKRLSKKLEWRNMGPDNVGGRLRGFLMHGTKKNLWFAGSVSGGLFRSNTYGQSWTPVNDMAENLSVTCIAQLPKSGKILYGTGEGGFTNLAGTKNGSPAFYGSGIYISTDDEGTDFEIVNTAKDTRFWQCNAMVAHPSEDIIYVATESGLFALDYSSGNAALTRVGGGAMRDLAIGPDGSVWCSSSSGAIYKKDATATTIGPSNLMNSDLKTNGRTALAVSPDDANYVYALGSNSNGSMGALYRTTDGGENWEILFSGNSVNDLFGPNRQGWFDNVISVVPGNKNDVLMGGVTLAEWDEENGFREIASTFNAPWNRGYIHSDKHMIQWDTTTTPATCIIGSDGGLFSSKDKSVWTQINRGFTTLQLYNVAANELGYVVGGSQDNGTYLINFTGNSFGGEPSKTGISIYGGDGFDVEFSKFDPNIVFMSTYYGNVARTSNLGQSSSTFWDDRQDGGVQSDFYTTYNLWEKNLDTSRLYLAKNNQVWAAINPTDFANPVNWFLVGNNLGNGRIVEMDYTPEGNHLFIAKSGAVWRLDNLNDAEFTLEANPTANDIPDAIIQKKLSIPGVAGRVVTSVNVDPNDANHVVLTLGAYGNSVYVLESEDALSANPTFTNITGNLPKMPVYDAVIDVDDANRIVLGTELGMWATEDGGATWEEANDGMARVPVFEMRAYEWRPWEGMTIYAGTHGRGYYKSESLLTNTDKFEKTNVAWNVFPNPSTDKVNASFSLNKAETAKISVYDVNGNLIKTNTDNLRKGANTISMDVTHLPVGYYILRMETENGISATNKFLKK